MIGLAVALAAVALVLTRGRAGLVFGGLSATTVAVVGVDAARGGRLQLDAPMMNNAIVAGRFTGLGNVGYGFLVGAAIVAAALVLERCGAAAWARRLVAGALGGVVIVDGAPMFGADIGGVIAAVVAFGLLMLIARGRSSWRAMASLAGAAFAMLVALALIDINRPRSAQTHLAGALSSGDAFQTLLRRLLAAVGSFRSSPWVAVVVIAIAMFVAGRERLPAARAARGGLVALAVAATLGAILNDSGVAVSGAVLAAGWPAYLALSNDARGGPAQQGAVTGVGGG
jgi:hypothetical protein